MIATVCKNQLQLYCLAGCSRREAEGSEGLMIESTLPIAFSGVLIIVLP
jgi:hypothetical protein